VVPCVPKGGEGSSKISYYTEIIFIKPDGSLLLGWDLLYFIGLPFSNYQLPFTGKRCPPNAAVNKFELQTIVMKKIALLVIISTSFVGVSSQNIGIGTGSPTEKLDVNGNVNIQGNLKLGGINGQNGQVLMTDMSGSTVWADIQEYKNHIAYSQNGIWNVPAGVTKVMIEAWGGGGGGAKGGGGASGSYIRAKNVPVAPGNAINITIGIGGSGATDDNAAGLAGGNTVITVSPANIIFTAQGGYAGLTYRGGIANNSSQIGLPYVIGIPGNNGENTSESYQQYNATDFLVVTKYGDGGNAVVVNSGAGKGGFKAKYSINATVVKIFESSRGQGYGSGGGAGQGSIGPLSAGSSGAEGIVIIHY
jgi:hypothetical protein